MDQYTSLCFSQYEASTLNSKRTRVVNESIIEHSNLDEDPRKNRKKSFRRKKSQSKSNKFKETKLQGMDVAYPTDESMTKATAIIKLLDAQKYVFFSGKESAYINNHKKNDGHILSAHKDCVVVDDKEFIGIIGYDDNGNVMFIKVPRKHAINHDNTPIVSIYVNSLNFQKAGNFHGYT